MKTWVDHIVWAVPDVGAAVERIVGSWGITPTVGGSHDGRGTHNVLVSLGGSTYLEVIGPDPSQPDPGRPRSFGVDDLDPGGEGRLAGWAMGTSDIDGLVSDLRAVGVDPGEVRDMSRTKPDGVRLSWRLTLSEAERGPAVPFLIDWADTPSPATDSASGCSLRSLTIHASDTALLEAYQRVGGLDLQCEPGPQDGLSVVCSTPLGEARLQS